jgi:polysaccharide pyruvyl transferase WcaK-like protein
MRLIAPFGFYGAGNIGDESTLQGFARLVEAFDPGTHAWIASRNTHHTRRVEPSFGYFRAESRDVRRRWAWMTGDAMVVPGGTPIMDSLGAWPFSELVPLVERANKEGKPIAFIGTGTERLVHDDSRRTVAELLAPSVLSWTVRCRRDRDRLIEYGVHEDSVTATADQAWLLESVSSDVGTAMLRRIGVDAGAYLVGVNVNIEHAVRAQQPNLLGALAEFLDQLIDSHDAHVLFLCNEVRDGSTFDLAASRELIASMTRQDRTTIVPNEYWPPQVMLSLISCCQVTISTRYHFCLFSALQGVPFLAVKRSDKVSDLCDDMQWQYGVALSELSSERLAVLYAGLASRRQQLRGELAAAVPKMRERASRNDLALRALQTQLRG